MIPKFAQDAAEDLAKQVRAECGQDAEIVGVEVDDVPNDDGGRDTMITVVTREHDRLNEFMGNYADELDEWLTGPEQTTQFLEALRNA